MALTFKIYQRTVAVRVNREHLHMMTDEQMQEFTDRLCEKLEPYFDSMKNIMETEVQKQWPDLHRWIDVDVDVE